MDYSELLTVARTKIGQWPQFLLQVLTNSHRLPVRGHLPFAGKTIEVISRCSRQVPRQGFPTLLPPEKPNEDLGLECRSLSRW